MASPQIEPRGLASAAHSMGDNAKVDDSSAEFNNRDLIQKLFLLVLLFVASLTLLCLLFKAHPDLPPEFAEAFQRAVPSSLSYSELRKFSDLENVKTLFAILSLYKDSHQLYILCALSSTYLFFQAFPLFLIWLPGTGSAISLLAGALFGFFRGVLFCITMATIGPVVAYTLFAYTGKPILKKWFPSRIAELKKLFDSHSGNLLWAIIFLRVSPFPNFVINLASPVLGVPLKSFALATFLGLLPNTLMLVSMGVTLKELTSINRGMSMMMLLLALLTLASLLPGIIKKRLESNNKKE